MNAVAGTHLARLKVKVLPAFHLPPVAQESLSLNDGPSSSAWRTLTEAEFMALTGVSDPGEVALGLFEIPKHLLKVWWPAAEAVFSEGGGGQESQEFRRFARQLADHFSFKRVPLCPAARCEVLVSAGGLMSTGCGASAASAPSSGAYQALLINLGDQTCDVVLQWKEGMPGDASKQLLLRLSLDPRRGCAIPWELEYDTCTVGRTQPEILVRIC